MTIEDIPISQLSFLERNPRRITKDQMEKLEKSLQEDPGFLKCRPILVNHHVGVLTVYAGNQRVKAAKKLKWETVPCIIEDNLSEEVMKSRCLKDNKTYGEFDWDELANSFEVDMLLDCGFSEKDLHLDLKPTEEIEPKQEKPKTKKECPSCGYEF